MKSPGGWEHGVTNNLYLDKGKKKGIDDHPKSKPKIPQEIRFQDCTILNYLFGWILVLKFAAAEHTNPFCGLRHRCQCWSNHLGLWPRLLTQDLLVWGVFFWNLWFLGSCWWDVKNPANYWGVKNHDLLGVLPGGWKFLRSFSTITKNVGTTAEDFPQKWFSCTEEHRGQAHFLK